MIRGIGMDHFGKYAWLLFFIFFTLFLKAKDGVGWFEATIIAFVASFIFVGVPCIKTWISYSKMHWRNDDGSYK